ncbi:fimbrillin family protein [Parabacteroides sp.]
MKRASILQAACALASLLTLAACTGDELAERGTELPAGKYPITFATTVETPALTRSTTDNSWDGGERIALMVGDEVREYAASSTDGILSAPSGVTPFYWQAATEKKTVRAWYTSTYSGTEPASFAVQADQSGEGYQKSDFLYAPAKEISFSDRADASLGFYHQTARVVINIKNAEAATSTDAIESVRIGYADNLALSGSYTVPTGPGNTAGIWNTTTGRPAMGAINPKEPAIPNTLAGGETALASYTALVIPQDMTGKPFIAIKLKGDPQTYSYTPRTGEAALQGGKLYTYDITVKQGRLEVAASAGGVWDKAGITRVFTASQLKPGDFYYSDGTTSDGGLRKIYADGKIEKAAELPSPESGKTVIGIVFQTDMNRMGEKEKEVLSQKGIEPHGLVLAVHRPGYTYLWAEQTGTVLTPKPTLSECYNDISGLGNASSLPSTPSSFPAFGQTTGLPTAPDKSTGWFLPSAGQCWDILLYLGGYWPLAGKELRNSQDSEFYSEEDIDIPANLNSWMSKVTGKNDFSSIDNENWYWLSTEFSAANAWGLFFNAKQLYITKIHKKTTIRVMYCLAF